MVLIGSIILWGSKTSTIVAVIGGIIMLVNFVLFFVPMPLPSRIEVGIDGVLVRRLWRTRFIPIAQIRYASPDGKNSIVLQLTCSDASDVERFDIVSSGASRRDALLAQISEALVTSYRSIKTTTTNVATLVGRGTQTKSQWLSALAKLRDTTEGYREMAVREEDLWQLVEDPSAPEDVRAGAAMVLRRTLDENGKTRLCAAANATVSPKLRVALDVAADSDEKMTEALRAITDDR
ncbi:MAG: hypothetical protein FWD69_14765 [Polyangiaceae bacterium]|nr:hypothetical protein [Polyangiaceae bacterium]